jgi:hypothetical protein
MVSSYQYFGDPIHCIPKENFPVDLLDTYCWIHSTFSIQNAWKKELGVDVPYFGVDNSSEGKIVYHTYYQWVCFVLFFQAMLFYVPRYLWKAVESGLIKNLILGLDAPILNEDQKEKSRSLLVEYLHQNLNNHNKLFLVYVITEALNLLNVITQMVLMDIFLGGQFTNYGWEVINFSEWHPTKYDPMVKVFPRVTKCTFYKGGSGGGVDKLDTLCVLPINILNEKIYIFLWFWFYFLAIMSTLAIIYRAITIFYPRARVMVTQSHCRNANKHELQSVLNNYGVSDWFVINLLSKNLSSFNFKELIHDLNRRMEGKSTYNKEVELDVLLVQ